MTPFQELQDAWCDIERQFMSSRPISRLLSGQLNVAHYAAYLRETYFYTRENPQIQAVATAWFRGPDREMVRPFLRHALSEVGHDRLALEDLTVLGGKIEDVLEGQPLPNTVALISFPYYSIQYRSAGSYLGYLFFLEFLPTSRGGEIAAALATIGVPVGAMRFLAEHRNVDVHHNRMMQHYTDHMLRTTSAIKEVLYAMRVSRTSEDGRDCAGVSCGRFPVHASNGGAAVQRGNVGTSPFQSGLSICPGRRPEVELHRLQ